MIVDETRYDSEEISYAPDEIPVRSRTLFASDHLDNISAFAVLLEYDVSDWEYAAAVYHESLPIYDGPDIFEDGIILNLFSEGDTRAKRRYIESNDLEEYSTAECVMVAQKLLQEECGEIIDHFERCHEITQN